MLASAGTALAVERIAYRPLRKKNAPPLIFLITAIGCSLVLVEIFGQVLQAFFGAPFGRATVNVPSADRDRRWSSRLGDRRITNIQLIDHRRGAVVMMVALDSS